MTILLLLGFGVTEISLVRERDIFKVSSVTAAEDTSRGWMRSKKNARMRISYGSVSELE